MILSLFFFFGVCSFSQIDELLSYGVNVTVYNGQVSSSLPHSYCVYIDLQRK
jgi:hypothetical protein